MPNQHPAAPSSGAVEPGMRVLDVNGKALGTVTGVTRDDSGQPAGFTIQHGLFGRKHKPVPAHLIRDVREGVVTVRFSAAEFKALSDHGERA